jgi:cytochrome c-type biogenesis protein
MNAVAILVALAAGALSFASPCCLPMVPVYVSYLLGTVPQPATAVTGEPRAATTAAAASAAAAAAATTASATAGAATAAGAAWAVADDETRARRRAALRHALVFVAGFTTVFVTLWASVGVVGYLLRDYTGTLRVAGGAVLILFGLHTAGLVEISLLYRQVGIPLRRLLPRQAGEGVPQSPHYGRSLLLGVVFAAGWTPCVGPILGGIIGLASASSSVAQGTVLLVSYAIGLGVPFVLVALGVNEVSRRMRWFAVHHVGVGLVTGAALMITGFLLITNLFVKLSGALPAVSL